MKKTKTMVGMVLAIVLMLGILSGAVNAFSMNMNAANEVKKGEEVVVTVKFEEKLSAAGFDLNYDSSVFSYVADSAKIADGDGNLSVNSSTAGKLSVAYVGSNGATTMTFTFKANENKENAKFTVTATSTAAKPDLTEIEVKDITAGNATVTVKEDKTDLDPVKPDDNNQIGSSSDNNQNNQNNQNSQKPSSLPKTGVNYVVPTAAGLVLIVLAGAFVARNKRA